MNTPRSFITIIETRGLVSFSFGFNSSLPADKKRIKAVGLMPSTEIGTKMKTSQVKKQTQKQWIIDEREDLYTEPISYLMVLLNSITNLPPLEHYSVLK